MNFSHFTINRNRLRDFVEMTNENRLIIFSVLVSTFFSDVVFGTELTFELEDNAETCFNEIIGADVSVSFDYQVKVNGIYSVTKWNKKKK